MPWFVGEVKDKIMRGYADTTSEEEQTINAVEIRSLRCVSPVANQFLDMLSGQEFGSTDLKKLALRSFKPTCMPFQEEIMGRLA